MSFFDALADELIVIIGVLQPIKDVCGFSTINIRFSKLVDNQFWRFKFLHDFGNDDIHGIVFWKKAYQNYGLTYGFGDCEALSFLPNPNQEYNQQGSNSEEDLNENFLYPTLAPNHRFKSVACGNHHTLAIDLNDNVLVFGYNESGQLGLGDIDYVQDPTFLVVQDQKVKAKFIACGYSHSALIDLQDNVWIFGDNSLGKLGLGNNKDIRTLRMLSWNHESKSKFIACGVCYTMLIDFNDKVWVFGDNGHEQLGLGDDNHRNMPTLLHFLSHESKAKYIACGSDHTVLIDLENNVWVFGDNFVGQLGLSDTQSSNIPTPLTINDQNMKAKMAACGDDHTILIDLEDNVWVFGCNNDGQLGLRNKRYQGQTRLYNIYIPTLLIIDEQVIKAKSVACGSNHTLLIDMDDNVLSFGNDEYGQTGGSDRSCIIEYCPENIRIFRPIKARYIACGENFSFVLLHPTDVEPEPVKQTTWHAISISLPILY